MSASCHGTDWRAARLAMMTEAGVAEWLASDGVRVVEHNGRYWQEVVPGFFQPVHYLARFEAEALGGPRRLCWGRRAVLVDRDAARANAVLPVHVLPDLASYGLQRLDGRRRNAINKALRKVEPVVLATPGLLLAQGSAVIAEAAARNHHNRPVTKAPFDSWARALFKQPGPLVVAMLEADRLLAFSITFAVDGTAYFQQHFVGHAGRSLNLDRLCFHVSALIAKATPEVATLVNGLHTPENAGLADFKQSQGLVVRAYPSLTVINPLATALIRRFRPNQYYRLTGRRRAAGE